ncbi:hypothetical protein ANRL3_01107 [Anaerolineae bacterium]|nr:hypothetical protein ANRL3_01107 [Anaerolineae bacterium]
MLSEIMMLSYVGVLLGAIVSASVVLLYLSIKYAIELIESYLWAPLEKSMLQYYPIS